MKMKNATVRLTTFHPPHACWSMIELRLTLPASKSTGIVDIPIEISYETICALERRPPSSAYLLFDDQPAITMPYTPIDEMARMNRKPTGIGASTMSMTPQREPHGDAKGITAQVMSAGMNDNTGARMNSGRFA